MQKGTHRVPFCVAIYISLPPGGRGTAIAVEGARVHINVIRVLWRVLLFECPVLFTILLHPHKQRKQRFPIKWDKRIQIRPPTVHGLVADK